MPAKRVTTIQTEFKEVKFKPGCERTFTLGDFVLRFKDYQSLGTKRFVNLVIIDGEVPKGASKISYHQPSKFKPIQHQIPLVEGRPQHIRLPNASLEVVIDHIKFIDKTHVIGQISHRPVIRQNPQTQDNNINTFYDQLFYVTARAEIFDKIPYIGTLFLVEAPLNDWMGNTALLGVTNRHVLANPIIRTEITFHKWNSDLSGPDPKEIVKMESADFREEYFAHPDPKIDLALVDLTHIAADISYLSIPLEMISDFSEQDLGTRLPVDFVGYPNNRFDMVHYKPLLRTGHIASSPKDDYNGEREFIIDAQVIGGSSGSPVFTHLNGEYKLIGIVAATDIKFDPIKQLVSFPVLGVEHSIGLGHVIKSTALRELIEIAVKAIKKSRESQNG